MAASSVTPVPSGPAAGATGADLAEPRAGVPLYVWLFLAGLATSIFSGFTGLMGIPVPLDRVCFAGAIVLLLLDPTTERLRWHAVFAVMLAVVGWTAWSALSVGTLLQSKGLFALADRIVVPFLMFCLGPLIFTNSRRRDLLLRTICLVGIYLSVTGIFELFGPHSLVWPRYIMDESIGILFGRARGPFVSAEPDGMVMALSLFMSILLWLRTPRRDPWRLLPLVAAPLSALGVVLCLTRSVWIATVAAVLIVGVIVPAARRRLPLFLGAVVVVFAAVLTAVPQVAQSLDERVNMKSSIYDRQNTNAAALRIVAEDPVFGVGWQRFTIVGPTYVRQDPNYPVSNINIEVHDVFLSRAAETGVFGAVLWGLAVLLGPVGVVLGLQRRRGDLELYQWTLLLIGALCVWLVPSLVSPNPYPLPNNLMWLIAGIAGRRELVRGLAPAPAPAPTPDHDAEDDGLTPGDGRTARA